MGNVRMTNTEVRLSNPCCRVKAVSIQYYEAVSVALAMQYATRMHPMSTTVICDLSGSTVFFHIIS